MRYFFITLLCVLRLVLLSPAAAQELTVHFSPNGGCANEVIAEINAAGHSVHLEAYYFSDTGVANALIAAHNRGVEVTVIVDGQQSSHAAKPAALKAAGVTVLADWQHSIAHNKVTIIDSYTVLTGSFNFTPSADHHNAENLLTVRNSGLAKTYETEFQKHVAHSESL